MAAVFRGAGRPLSIPGGCEGFSALKGAPSRLLLFYWSLSGEIGASSLHREPPDLPDNIQTSDHVRCEDVEDFLYNGIWNKTEKKDVSLVGLRPVNRNIS